MTVLTLQEVSDVTKKFSTKIGEGAFGPVYYGKLSSGQEVALKVKKSDSRQGTVEFFNEVCLEPVGFNSVIYYIYNLHITEFSEF